MKSTIEPLFIKNIFITITVFFVLLLDSFPTFSQDDKRAQLIGLNPSVTVEPYYGVREFDIGILPLVYQTPLTKQLDLRLTSILNFGVRTNPDKGEISHVGLEAAAPFHFRKKEGLSSPSSGLYIGPVFSASRNRLDRHTNYGIWLEPGYHLLFKDGWALQIGLQAGATYFDYGDFRNNWGNHFGLKVVFGKWL